MKTHDLKMIAEARRSLWTACSLLPLSRTQLAAAPVLLGLEGGKVGGVNSVSGVSFQAASCHGPKRQQAARSPRRGALMIAGALLALVLPLVAEEKIATKPDPAAHTVIVPYDVKQPLGAAKPDRFYLDYADFQKLWALAKENRKPEKPIAETGKPEASINAALYEAEVLDTGLRVKARFSVVTRGGKWVKLALPFKSATGTLAVSEVKLDGNVAAFQDGAVLIEEPGAHSVDATLELTLERAWKSSTLALPQAGAALLTFTVPGSDGRPAFGDVMSGFITEEVRGERRAFTLPMGNAATLSVTRTPSRRLVADAPPAQADARMVLRVMPRMERLSGQVEFAFAGTERKAVSVEIDPALRIESASATPAGAVILRKDGDKQFLDVGFTQAAADSATVQFSAVRVFEQQSATGARIAPVVRAVAARENVMLEVLAADDLQVKPAAAPGNERVAALGKATEGEQAVGAWRLPPGGTLSYVVSAAEDRSVAKVEALHQLGVQKAEVIAAITLDTGRAPLLEARIGVPAGFEVQSLTGPRVLSWHREGDELRLRFSEDGQREAKLVVHLAKTLAQAATTWTLEPLKLPQFAKQETTTLIATHAADDVKLAFDAADRKMREVDPATLTTVLSATAPMQVKRAMRIEKADWSAQVTLTRQAPRFSVDAVLLAQAGDLGLRLSQQVGVNVEQGAVGAVKLRLPADLPEARVRGAAVRDAQSKIVNGVREYDVSFQAEALDRADFTLDLDLPLEGEKVLPVLQVDGAGRTQRFVIVDNAGSREMKLDPAGTDSAVKENIPYLPDGLTRPQFFRAQDKAAIKLAFTQLESTAGNAAIVTLAEITTALRPNGERWETVVYSLANRSLQFLPVRLPEGAELVEVSVGGQTVRADKAESGKGKAESGNAEFLVPLIQMRAGELSQQVRLVYRVPANDDGVEATHALDDPQLVGLSAERTLWNVWVPDGYEAREFDGNMDEVGEEGRELEKQRSLLSEVARLNRVMSSDDVEYEDAKMAQDNANKALGELRRYDAERKSKSSGAVFKGKVMAQKEQKVVEEIQADVVKQIEDQGKLTVRNSGNLKMLEGKDRAQVLQGHGQVSVAGGDARFGNDWNWNNAAQSKTGSGQALATALGQTFLNDFVCVSNGFFGKAAQLLTKSGNGTLALTGESKPATDAPQMPQQFNFADGTTNLTSNARSTANFQVQQAQMPQSQTATGVVAGTGGVTISGGATLTLPGVNTYSGGTTINAGTLTLGGTSTVNAPQMLEQAKDMAAGGRYADARQLAMAAANAGAGTPAVKFMEQLDDPNRFEAALSPEHVKKVGEVEGKLQQGYSAYNLGDYDKAIAAFQDVMRLDNSNAAARRGLERAETRKSEYFDTARDQLRAKMLNEVNRGWENGGGAATTAATPRAGGVAANADPFAPAGAPAAAGKPAEQPMLGRLALWNDDETTKLNIDALGVTPQLKPVGRVSLAVEVPLSGTAFHFRKLKDHAALDVTVVKPWEPREKVALWALLAGVIVLVVSSLLRRGRWAQATA